MELEQMGQLAKEASRSLIKLSQPVKMHVFYRLPVI